MRFCLSSAFVVIVFSALGASEVAAQNTHALASNGWDVRTFGAVGDGTTDCTHAFQRAVDSAARGVAKTVFIPPGRFVIRQPIFVDSPGVKIAGMGEESHVVVDGFHPGFVFGVRRVEKEGRAIDASYRPDVAGKLDHAAAPEPGKRHGFATNGRVFLSSVSHPAQVGARTRRTDDRCFDYWGECPAFTLEACLEPQQGRPWKPGAPLLGLGSVGVEPGPWCLGVGNDAQTLVFSFKTADMPEAPDTGDHRITIPLNGATPPYRVRVWLDFASGKAGATVNEREVADTVSDHTVQGKPWRPGMRFLHSRARHPFLIGTDGEAPSVTDTKVTPLRLYGLRVSRAVRSRPQNDAEAYLNSDADTVFYLPLTGEPGRSIDLNAGRAADGMNGSALLIHGDGYVGGINSNAITDLKITGGSAGVLLGGALRFRIERVRAGGGMVGLGSVPIVVSYPVTIRDCEFDGFDAAVSLWRCEVRASGVDLERGGQTSLRLRGCSAFVQDCMFYFNSGVAETAIDIQRGEGWGKYSFRNLNVDNEARGFDRAVLRCEWSAYTRPLLHIDGFEASQVGKSAALIELVDHPVGAGINPSQIEVRRLLCYTPDYGAVVRVDGPNWFGRVETTLLKGPHLDYRGAPGTKPGVKFVTEREAETK